MKVQPLLVASALLLVGVMALGATAVVGRRQARARRPPPPLEVEAPPGPAPRYIFVPPEAPPPPAEPEAPPEATAALHLRVTGPHGLLLAEASATLQSPGDAGDEATTLDAEEDHPGLLSATDLSPGRYDLVVSAPGMRDAKLAGVPTGDDVVDVSLARAPVLLGALGATNGRGCEGATVVVLGAEGSDDETTVTATLDADDCTFVVEALPDTGPLTVVARRGDEVDRALVTLPSAGDPGFVCLAPPCAAAPGSLAIYVADASGAQVDGASLEWTLAGDELRSEIGSNSGAAALTYLHDRQVGDAYHLRVTSDDRTAEATALVGPGVTEVVLTLPAGAPSGARAR